MENTIDGKAFRALSYGLYVVTSVCDKKANGQIANTVFQVTSNPPQMAVCINKDNLTHACIEKSGVFGVSVLDEAAPLLEEAFQLLSSPLGLFELVLRLDKLLQRLLSFPEQLPRSL